MEFKKVDYRFHYTISDYVPPRCRKPRPVLFSDGEYSSYLRLVSASEAPLVLSYDYLGWQGHKYDLRVRKFDEQFWMNYLPNGAYYQRLDEIYAPASEDIRETNAANHPLRVHTSRTRKDIESSIQDHLDNVIEVDGMIYIRLLHEPVWELRNRHDYWWVSLRFFPTGKGCWDRENMISKPMYYAMDDFHNAIAHVNRNRSERLSMYKRKGYPDNHLLKQFPYGEYEEDELFENVWVCMGEGVWAFPKGNARTAYFDTLNVIWPMVYHREYAKIWIGLEEARTLLRCGEDPYPLLKRVYEIVRDIMQVPVDRFTSDNARAVKARLVDIYPYMAIQISNEGFTANQISLLQQALIGRFDMQNIF